MTYKNPMGIFPDKTSGHISLLKYTKKRMWGGLPAQHG